MLAQLDIRAQLTPARKKGYYICPACGGDKFSVGASGQYGCWSGCNTGEITQALKKAAGISNAADKVADAKKSFNERFDEWYKRSAVSKAITEANLFHTTTNCRDIADMLGWKGYGGSAGWFSRSVDPANGALTDRGQFKPDDAIEFADGTKAKYISYPKGKSGEAGEAIYLRVPVSEWRSIAERWGVPLAEEDVVEQQDDKGFWQWVQRHPEIPITLAEGIKKTACLLSYGRVAICLTGVEGGHISGKDIVPSLKPFVTAGRSIFLCFDADLWGKEPVRKALNRQCQLMREYCALATIRICMWAPDEGKGVDDLLAGVSPELRQERLDTVMQDAATYAKWLEIMEHFAAPRSPSSSSSRTTKQAKQAKRDGYWEAINQVVAKYRNNLVFCAELDCWMHYQHSEDIPGCWQPVREDWIVRLIDIEFQAMQLDRALALKKESYVAFKNDLYLERWQPLDRQRYIPFLNGVLDFLSKKLLQHSPGYRNTSCLPRKFDPEAAELSTITTFLEQLAGDTDTKHVLMCYLNACLKGSADIQCFLHLIGAGGAGKGTFIHLVSMLVGLSNTYTSDSLPDFCASRFEMANLFGKRLVVFPEVQSLCKDVGRFFMLTGGDMLKAERKCKQEMMNFYFHGMAIVASNKPIFCSESSSASHRRAIVVECNKPVAATERRNLLPEFELELAALTNVLLNIPDDEVRQVLSDRSGKYSNAVSAIEAKKETSSIAAFADAMLIEDSDHHMRVGSNKDFNPLEPTAWAAYYRFCQDNELQPMSNIKFSRAVLEFCNSSFEWILARGHDRKGNYISGCRVRLACDEEIPPYSITIAQRKTEPLPTPVPVPEPPKPPLRKGTHVKVVEVISPATPKPPLSNLLRIDDEYLEYLGQSGVLVEDQVFVPKSYASYNHVLVHFSNPALSKPRKWIYIPHLETTAQPVTKARLTPENFITKTIVPEAVSAILTALTTNDLNAAKQELAKIATLDGKVSRLIEAQVETQVKQRMNAAQEKTLWSWKLPCW